MIQNQPLSQPVSHRNSLNNPNANKEKMNLLLSEMFNVGTLRGFRYFETYLRGREELIIRLFNDQINMNDEDVDSIKSRIKSFHRSKTSSSIDLAMSQPKGTVSHRTQLMINKTGLPPASPCEREIEQDTTKTAFLIAAYARYGRPFIWLRSNHQLFINMDDNEIAKDGPLNMKSTDQWLSEEISLSAMISELISYVQVSKLPSDPINPFSVDHDFFDSLPLEESLPVTAGLIDFLEKVLILKPNGFAAKVKLDLMKLQKRHLKDMVDFVTNGNISAKSSIQGSINSIVNSN